MTCFGLVLLALMMVGVFGLGVLIGAVLATGKES